MRILVVEDDSDLRRQLADVLSQSGYAVDLAADGEDGHFLAPCCAAPPVTLPRRWRLASWWSIRAPPVPV